MSSYDRYQLPSDAVHTLSAAREIADGGAIAYPGDRWGDFVGRGPGSARHERGLAGQPVHEEQTARGARASASSRRPARRSCRSPRSALLDSRTNIGTTGAFVSSVPKTIDIAGRLGIPNDAVAITGNLTVTGQQQAGYASLTVLPDPNPATSTINFPLGDNRANNLTSPLEQRRRRQPHVQGHGRARRPTSCSTSPATSSTTTRGRHVQGPHAGARPRHPRWTSASTTPSRRTRTASSRSPAA